MEKTHSLLMEKQNFAATFGCCTIGSGMGGCHDLFGFAVNSLDLNLKYCKNYCKRPGRDVRSVLFPNRISNPGQGSDSPPYWTGMYDSGCSARSNQASLYYPGARNPNFL